MDKKNTLFIGYGNPDRQDDGVAWHVLAGIAQKLGRKVPAVWEDPFENDDVFPHMMFLLQLNPEISEILAEYQNICFIDAHTGNIPNDIQFGEITSGFQTSPFTHHITAESVLALTRSLYHAQPNAYMLSVRGYAFGFTQDLSPQTTFLTAIAINKGIEWLSKIST
jgi:Ni,Fe-hydrogenase maturation factor